MNQLLLNYLNRLRYRIKVYLRFFKLHIEPGKKQNIIDQFHILYYDSQITGGTWNNTFFLGVPIQKCPLDLFIYQEILYEVLPDIIIESGTAYGGGALYLASICDLLKHGQVITIDITNTRKSPNHKRIKYLLGSSTSQKIINQIKQYIKNKRKILVILDSDHSKEHVSKELIIYSRFVTKGSYLIVEDTNVNGHPVYKEHGAGPMEAVEQFLKIHKNFRVDKTREKFYFSFNPMGFLKRIK